MATMTGRWTIRTDISVATDRDPGLVVIEADPTDPTAGIVVREQRGPDGYQRETVPFGLTDDPDRQRTRAGGAYVYVFAATVDELIEKATRSGWLASNADIETRFARIGAALADIPSVLDRNAYVAACLAAGVDPIDDHQIAHAYGLTYADYRHDNDPDGSLAIGQALGLARRRGLAAERPARPALAPQPPKTCTRCGIEVEHLMTSANGEVCFDCYDQTDGMGA